MDKEDVYLLLITCLLLTGLYWLEFCTGSVQLYESVLSLRSPGQPTLTSCILVLCCLNILLNSSALFAAIKKEKSEHQQVSIYKKTFAVLLDCQ